jgi:choline dehydrogenase-like flavoprotein
VVVVGAGLVGSVVVAKMAEALPGDFRILVLEAGKASHFALGGTEAPASVGADGQWQVWSPGLENVTRYDVPGNYPVQQCWARDCEHAWQGVPGFQCKILGGCGVMNGALTQVPQSGCFASWPSGWQWSDLEHHMAAAEELFHVSQTPSVDGKHYLDDAGASLVKGALAGYFSEVAPRQPQSWTMGVPFVTAKGGVRQSTASVLLPAALSRPNVSLRLESLVSAIEHDGAGSATGVRYTRGGQSEVVRLSRRGMLVLSGGALNTPRLLLASGVVPGNGAVGRGVSDHTYAAQKYKLPAHSTVSVFPYSPPTTASIEEYAANRSGGLAQFGPLLTAFWRSPNTTGSAEVYDVEMWVAPTDQPSEVTLHFSLMRPACSSADVVLAEDNTAVFENNRLHLKCKQDQDTMSGAQLAFQGWMHEMGAEPLGAAFVGSMFHYVGSCALGSCVDPDTLIVRESTNIAVADASIVPEQVWGHPALTLQAVALRAAEILSEGALLGR